MFGGYDDDIFGGTPRSKYFDVIFNANRNLVEEALSSNLKRIAVLEKLLEERLGDDEDIESLVQNYLIQHMDEVEHMLNDAYINGMGDILTQNE